MKNGGLKNSITSKNNALAKQSISFRESENLLHILQSQETASVKEGAYYSLLAKKFLWDNHQPGKARTNLRQAIARKRLRWQSYGLYLLSFLPEKWLRKSYALLKQTALHDSSHKKSKACTIKE